MASTLFTLFFPFLLQNCHDLVFGVCYYSVLFYVFIAFVTYL